MDDWRSKMEAMVINADFWRGRRVFLTGHTGFKGAWLSLMLYRLGANVTGFALAPENREGVYQTAGVDAFLAQSIIGDIRDPVAVTSAVQSSRPELVIHAAAQSLVLRSYQYPAATFATNILGTVHILEAVRRTPGVRSVVVITSDKCYENAGGTGRMSEDDPLGGRDPYSSSKAGAELVVNAYRQSFLTKAGCAVASVRGGNVIGGGDFAEDRLVPDAVRAFIAGHPLRLRSPRSVRPWQHVLDLLRGYLLLAERISADGTEFAEAWNFGPALESEVSVQDVASTLVRLWGAPARWEAGTEGHQYEAEHLSLDSTKARDRLGWSPMLDLEQGLALTIDWYRAAAQGQPMHALTMSQIERFLALGPNSVDTHQDVRHDRTH